MFTVLSCLTTEHDLRLVLLAGVVCLIGVTAALRIFVHAREIDGSAGLAWLGLTGAVGGASVWATHFIAMLGYSHSQAAGFEPLGTAASFVIAVLGFTGAFTLAGQHRGRKGAIVAGVTMALVIGAMHYVGMSAFQPKGVVSWNLAYIGASVGLAAVLAPLSLMALGRGEGWNRTLGGAGLMVVAICSLHFTGMAAVTVTALDIPTESAVAIDRTLMAVMVAGVACILISAALLVGALDRWNRGAATERFAEALEAMTDGLAYYDARDRLTIWNGHYHKTCPEIEDQLVKGITFEQILRLGVARGHYPDALGQEEDWIAERLAVRQSGGEAIEQHMADGRWLRIQDRRSAMGGTVSTIIDVTDLKEFAVRLEQARDEAEAANRAKSEFLANMSHEIRTPLNGILGVAEVLSRTSLTSEQTDMLRLISTSGVTLQQLLSDILDLARVESGRLSLSTGPLDLAEIVRDAGRLYEAAAHEKGLQFYVEVAPEAEIWAKGDLVRIKQVLTNLVSNAVKFTHTGFVRLTASRAADVAGQSVFRFTVEDTGVGFDEVTRARLFTRFEQADGSITRRFGGTGLGLAICRQLTEMMGGFVDCESEPGGGSTFILTLPLEVIETPESSSPATQDATEDDGVQAAALRILLADDHPTNRKVIELILSQIDIELVMVENGAQAVEAFDAQPFDIVLMDMQMPVMDGLSATRGIRDLEMTRNGLRTPIVMLTANALPEHVVAAREAGADRHLAKPVSVQSLLDCVNDLTRPGGDNAAAAAA